MHISIVWINTIVSTYYWKKKLIIVLSSLVHYHFLAIKVRRPKSSFWPADGSSSMTSQDTAVEALLNGQNSQTAIFWIFLAQRLTFTVISTRFNSISLFVLFAKIPSTPIHWRFVKIQAEKNPYGIQKVNYFVKIVFLTNFTLLDKHVSQ